MVLIIIARSIMTVSTLLRAQAGESKAIPGRWRTALLVVVLSIAACWGGGDRSVTFHPTDDKIPVITDPKFVLHEQGTAAPWVDFTAMQRQVIGVEEGAHHEMIGLLADLAIVPGTLIVYADFLHQEVRTYDRRGNFVGIIGTDGQGPGEFIQPRKVEIADDGELIIVGDLESRIQLFRRQDSTYVLQHSFRVSTPFGGICVMDRHLYTIGYSGDLDGVIHKYTLEGAYVTSFGAPYKTSTWGVADWISGRGSLQCNKKHRVIAYTNPYFPILTGYSESGDMVWRVKFPDARLVRVQVSKTANGAPSVTEATHEIGDSRSFQVLSSAESDALIVKYYTYDINKTSKWHLFRVDASSGEGAYLGWHAGWHANVKLPVLTALDAERLYAQVIEPYPQIGIYQRQDQ